MKETVERWHEAVDIPNLLLSLGEDLEREGLERTPERVKKTWEEFLNGYTLSAEELLAQTFESEGGGTQICRGIEFTSMCEHHLLPFFGKCHIGYTPKDRVAGLSKLARLVDCYGRRLQIQERMTNQIADAIWEHLEPSGVLVIIEARHMCCHGRGVERRQMNFLTTALRGSVARVSYLLLKGDE